MDQSNSWLGIFRELNRAVGFERRIALVECRASAGAQLRPALRGQQNRWIFPEPSFHGPGAVATAGPAETSMNPWVGRIGIATGVAIVPAIFPGYAGRWECLLEAGELEHHRGRWIAGDPSVSRSSCCSPPGSRLTPFVARELRTELNAQPNMSGDFDDLSLSVLGLALRSSRVWSYTSPHGVAPRLAWRSSRSTLTCALARSASLGGSSPRLGSTIAKLTVVIENEAEMKELIRQLQHIASMPHLGGDCSKASPLFAWHGLSCAGSRC